MVGQFFIVYLGNVHMDVYPVNQRTRRPLLVASDHSGGAAAAAFGIAGIPTGTGIHRSDQQKIGGKRQCPLSPADGHYLVLQRLAQGIQDPATKLGEFIQ
jgi:hypothetical protein